MQFGVPKPNSQIFQSQQKAVHYLQENKSKSQKKSSVQSVLTGTQDYVRVNIFPLQLSSCSCTDFVCVLLETAVKNCIQVVELAISTTIMNSPGMNWEASHTLLIVQCLPGPSLCLTSLKCSDRHLMGYLPCSRSKHLCTLIMDISSMYWVDTHARCYGVTIPYFCVISVQQHCYGALWSSINLSEWFFWIQHNISWYHMHSVFYVFVMCCMR